MFNLFARMGRLVKGFFSMFVSSTEDANPKALLALEIDKYNKTIADYNTNLGKSRGLAYRLEMQVKSDQAKLNQVKASMIAANSAGLADRAGQYALQVKELTASVAENTAQFAHSEEQHALQTRQRDAFVKEAKARIERVKGKISKTEMLESQAELAKMVSVQVFDTTGGGLSSIEESLDARSANAMGTTRVATDAIQQSTWLTTESEQKALEQQALAEMLGTVTVKAPAALSAPAVHDAVLVDLIVEPKVTQ